MISGLAALHVLIIDDSAQMREIVGTVLAAVGVHELYFASNGREALDVMAKREIDLCFVDYEMPVMDGLTFIANIRALKTKDRYMPLIMLTGHSDRRRLSQARDMGVTEFLGKPVTAKTILQRLESVILRPRGFIEASKYFGPDRRRRRDDSHPERLRRAADAQPAQKT